MQLHINKLIIAKDLNQFNPNNVIFQKYARDKIPISSITINECYYKEFEFLNNRAIICFKRGTRETVTYHADEIIQFDSSLLLPMKLPNLKRAKVGIFWEFNKIKKLYPDDCCIEIYL